MVIADCGVTEIREPYPVTRDDADSRGELDHHADDESTMLPVPRNTACHGGEDEE